MIDRISVEQCTLCGSCYNACPVDAISFKTLYLDFLYPAIDNSRCVGCDRCEKSCPILADKQEPESGYPIAFAARSRDEEARRKSSSGGVFYELASEILSEGGYICGAVFDDHFHVKHIVSNTQKDLYRMMGSKYAQSDMGMCFRQIKTLLDEGKNVLFTGCPCQVAGLRTYIGRKHPNLLLVELICHGIPSDHMLQTYIGMQERKYGARLTRMEFRNKKKGWHNSSVRMEFENGRVHSEPMTFDTYMQGYFRGVTLKESCFSCQFRGFKSGSDLTIGDLWGAEISIPDMDDNNGLSAVIVNSEKGTLFLNRNKIIRRQFEIDKILKYNQSLLTSFDEGAQRTAFYAYTEKYDLERAIETFFQETLLQKAKRKFRFFLRYAWYTLQGKGKPLY
jgi:coenzyme F420-reducing hydrogenase beta subunit